LCRAFLYIRRLNPPCDPVDIVGRRKNTTMQRDRRANHVKGRLIRIAEKLGVDKTDAKSRAFLSRFLRASGGSPINFARTKIARRNPRVDLRRRAFLFFSRSAKAPFAGVEKRSSIAASSRDQDLTRSGHSRTVTRRTVSLEA